ncbi:MAG: type II toxin-antitoxin system PemK/MazF family toxin [Acinetobacter populi]|jgi:hypothetical protein|uniref:type II toxin-antitoxin system PemK/MazF family toxin n=1 Tax=Acinetobacter populi TaxID=1582270 RepID=UPI002352DA31|nr:type II toxin-antitoxin system PemK/MazF family toxin [Acinetobacter populi]MCH4248294.1 type II toxin-antitoxin system PemK/MazF family toxin [Acinetobacter populi]
MVKELYWAYVGFTDTSNGKTRPVLYIRQTDTDYVVFRLSSQYDNKSAFIQSKYVEIQDWKQAGLTKQSWVDTVQTYHLSIDKIKLRYIGQLSAKDLERLIHHLELK